MTSEDEFDLLSKSQSDKQNPPKVMHRISSTSTIKSVYIESSPNSPSSSIIKKSERHLLAEARLRILQKPINLNIIVLGDSNIGKTSLIYSILAKYFNNIVPSLSSHKPSRPTRNIIDYRGISTDGEIELRVNFVDTPGYGFFTTTEKWLETIVNFIIKQGKDYKTLKKTSTSSVEDIRIHLALYMIEGPRCKETDLNLMHKLQKYINLVPAVAKADMYTATELIQVKLGIISQCSDAQIHFFDLAAALKEKIYIMQKSSLAPIPPFAIISGGDMLRTDNKISFIRKYPWGICDIHEESISDFKILCKLLFEYLVLPVIQSSKFLNKKALKKHKQDEKKAEKIKLNQIRQKKINFISNILSKFIVRIL